MNDITSQLITIENCATLAGLSDPGIRLHLKRGNLKGYRINGRNWIILTTDFAEFLKARATGRFTRQWKSRKTEVFNTCIGEPKFDLDVVLAKKANEEANTQ